MSSVAIGQRIDRAGKRLIAGHFDAEVARRLKMLAASQDRTVNAMLGDALQLLFQSYGVSSDPVVPAVPQARTSSGEKQKLRLPRPRRSA